MSLLDNASLVLTPNAYKEGKLYSVIPSNGNGDFTATRATTATRVNSDGLVDLVPYNLALWSEQFTTANSYLLRQATTTTNTTETSAPNGTLTADKIFPDGSNNLHQILSNDAPNTISFNTGTTYTQSIYAKAGNGTQGQRIQMLFSSARFTSLPFANFNLQTGALGTIGGGASATITAVGNGWYRCTLTATCNSTGTGGGVFMGLITSDTAIREQSFVGDTSHFIYAWGAQLVEGTSARDYLRTETRLNIPRVDYSLGGCPNILLEPQRTNLALQSSSFDSVTWVKANASFAANTTTSPNGVTDADKIVEDSTSTHHSAVQSVTTTSGLIYNISFFAKASERGYIQWNNTLTTDFANFDLINGVIGTSSGITNHQIQSVGNGWYRCSLNYTATFTGIASVFRLTIVLSASAARLQSYLGNGTSGVFLWGAQLEAGAYSTSFIPTTTASVTRNQDVVIKTGVSSLIGQAQGTLFLEARSFNFLGSGAGERISLTDGTFNNRINIDLISGNVQMVASNSTTGLNGTINATGVVSANSKFKIAVAYDGANSRLYVNGTAYTTIVGTIPTFSGQLSVVEFNQGNTARPFFGRVEELIVFPTRLSNAQLAQLTTL